MIEVRLGPCELKKKIIRQPPLVESENTPVEKSNICWLGMFWSMAAGLSWSLAGHELV